MKRKIEVTICDNCNKEFRENGITVLKKDFCSVGCLVEWVKKPHTKKCHVCGGTGYAYIDAGYGDDDVRCIACTNGTQLMSVEEAFITE